MAKIVLKFHISQYFATLAKFRVFPRTVITGNYRWEFPPPVFPGQPWCVYVKCLSYESKEPVIHFLDCIAVPDGKAETIVSEIGKLFQIKNVLWEKLTSLASDGAAVTIGRNSGVGVRLKEHSKNLVQVHCVAHKLALAAGQSCKDITLFTEYQLTLKQIYRFFSNSAVRYNGLPAMKEILEDEDMKYMPLKEPVSFRW